MNVLNVLNESLSMLLKQPKLFLPKLVIAALYGIGMLAIAWLSIETVVPLLIERGGMQTAKEVAGFLPVIFGFLIYTLVVYVLDVLVNSMYPVMVANYRQGKRISFRSAFSSAARKFPVIFPAMIVMLAIEFAVALPFAMLFTLFILGNNIAALIASFIAFLAVSFVMIVIFYVIYPASVLDENNFVSAIINTARLGKRNARHISIPSLIPFSLSIINFAVGFPALESLAFLAAFVILRFFMALLSTYHMVLNPHIYIELASKK